MTNIFGAASHVDTINIVESPVGVGPGDGAAGEATSSGRLANTGGQPELFIIAASVIALAAGGALVGRKRRANFPEYE